MKASVCFVFAVVCWFAAQAESSPKILTLSKVMNELNKINQGMIKNKSRTLNSPTINDLEDCCVKSALDCFRAKVFHLSVTDAKLKRSQKIISHELRKSVILDSVSNCKPEEIQKAQCKSCDSYKKVDSQTFVQNFQTLMQKIYASEA
ncbi:interleukin-21-like [Sinocyclocheilus anshuiensis]|uniref:interleukin-21-like n=1 Tax=Sinocyclocheilus anshuiensis TaxID=1608454 RepID=UPI0007B9AEB5|nr:PREDICTED: interleukin-21-like [Sinocyclocheilus anshuiensis]